MAGLVRICSLLVLCLALPAQADRGALTFELGGGGSGTLLTAPSPGGFTLRTSTTTPVTSGTGWLGVRYALSNNLELGVSGFYEPTVSVFHNQIVLDSATPPTSTFPGTLNHRHSAYGALAGARWVMGSVWRFSFGLDVGWARRNYTALAHYDDRNPTAATDYRLPLTDFATDMALLSAATGLEWAFSDKLSIAVLPRVHFGLGRGGVPALVLPVVVSYSWYL